MPGICYYRHTAQMFSPSESFHAHFTALQRGVYHQVNGVFAFSGIVLMNQHRVLSDFWACWIPVRKSAHAQRDIGGQTTRCNKYTCIMSIYHNLPSLLWLIHYWPAYYDSHIYSPAYYDSYITHQPTMTFDGLTLRCSSYMFLAKSMSMATCKNTAGKSV